MKNLYDLGRSQLTELLAGWSYSSHHAQTVWHNLYRERFRSLAEFEGVRADLMARLSAETTLIHPIVITSQTSSDGVTQKFLLCWPDGQAVETVIMAFRGRYTACISTQAGCAMGCVFCATGQMGFYRHLTPGEIVAQVLFVMAQLEQRDKTLRNVVLMGMGEPLHNYDNTLQAVDTLMDHHGLALAAKHITLSTVGIPQGIRRLADENRPIKLAVSLHAATDLERQAIVPLAKRWPLAELLDACRYYVTNRSRHIFFEWALIAGENDSAEQAHAVGSLLSDIDSHVNLIPLNATTGYDGRPSNRETVKQFQAILAEYGIPSTVRQRRGIDIAAGCGQLRATETPTHNTTAKVSNVIFPT
ncbi:MAG: 23S rRNA (adenine(2503)-C(2))-methyltransferase RlmN [Anaerolineae bacterium]|nr:23S rRNA (adenine(2503)-C(2))-methyltransferase RlmN [Anaerolineae bacterium]